MPAPEGGPSNVTLAFGSSLAQGDHFPFVEVVDLIEHRGRRRSCSTLRSTLNSDGWSATTMRNTAMIAAIAIRIFQHGDSLRKGVKISVLLARSL